jgi:hypothetical protein
LWGDALFHAPLWRPSARTLFHGFGTTRACRYRKEGRAMNKAERIAQHKRNHVLWSNDLTDAQLSMVSESGDHDGATGFGVELNGAGQWATARSLVKAGLGWIEGGAPNGSSLAGLYFNNRDGVEITHECDDEPDWEAEGRRIALEGMDLPDGAYFGMADELGLDP